MPKEIAPSGTEGAVTGAVPAIASKMLEKMRANPKDWRIDDVETLCRQTGLDCEPPRGGGSHFKAWSRHLKGILTIPAKRPIKPIYIKRLISLADAHIEKSRTAETDK
ncbi:MULTISPECIES: hypothetical protein [unclassified Bradyrhizobium]|uniref:hypothetical protein n=1 Tax=unclassified Bradyrhizobium TaxID=2631580 RepID=UPI0028E76904|nr:MULTISPECIES: hypothetical protein [unclassified Bradyrhizobium]